MITEKEIWDVINSPTFVFAKETQYSYKCTIGQSGIYQHMNYAYGETLFEAATHLVEDIKGEKYIPSTEYSNQQLELLKETVILDCLKSFRTKWVSDKKGEYKIICFVNETDNYYIKGKGKTMFEAAKDLYKKIHEEDNV